MSPPTTRPLVIAHRGASGHAHENSLEAFRLAAASGADGIELDVHPTADGALVVHHDPDLPGLGPIRGLDLARVGRARLPNGEPIPTLAQAMEAAPGLAFWIEVKRLPPALDEALLAAIDRAPDPGRCAVHSFDHRIVQRLGQRRPGLPRGVLSTSYLLDPAEPLRQTGAGALWQEATLIDAALVDTVHAAGGIVVAWTVNEASRAAELAALGVDALCGNFPERLRPS